MDQSTYKTKALRFPQDFYNIKCIIFSIYIGILYWILPRTAVSLGGITLINYFALNWYNHMYLCVVNNIVYTATYVVSLTILLAYLPRRSKWLLAASLYFPYLLMAWYDYLANCSFRMNPTIFPFGRFIYLPLKPAPYKRRYDQLDPVVKQNIANFDKYIVFSVTALVVIYGIVKYLV